MPLPFSLSINSPSVRDASQDKQKIHLENLKQVETLRAGIVNQGKLHSIKSHFGISDLTREQTYIWAEIKISNMHSWDGSI